MKYIKKVSESLLKLFIFIGMSPVFAALPKPPDSDMPSTGVSWADIGKTQVFKMLGISFVAGGAVLVLGVIAITFKSYVTAHERGDLGHFAKFIIAGLLMLVLGLGMSYFGYTIVTT